MKIKPEHEDKIFIKKKEIQAFAKAAEDMFDRFFEELKLDGMDEELEDFLWDYIFNDGSEGEFEDYLERYNYGK